MAIPFDDLEDTIDNRIKKNYCIITINSKKYHMSNSLLQKSQIRGVHVLEPIFKIISVKFYLKKLLKYLLRGGEVNISMAGIMLNCMRQPKNHSYFSSIVRLNNIGYKNASCDVPTTCNPGEKLS